MMFSKELFATTLAVERIIKRNLSLRDAAKQIGISASTLNRLEMKKQLPDIETFYKCCQWLPFSMDYFFKEGGEG